VALFEDCHHFIPFTFDAGAERAEFVGEAAAVYDVEHAGDVLAYAFTFVHGPDTDFSQ